MNRIESLESEKESIRQSLNTVSTTTAATNQIKVSTSEEKVKNAQKYLGQLALASEAIKIIMFIFLGYRCLQMNKHEQEQEQEQGKAAKKPVITSNYHEKEEESIVSSPRVGKDEAIHREGAGMYRLAVAARSTYKNRFKAYFSGAKGHTYESIVKSWVKNEARYAEACDLSGEKYVYEPMPTAENTGNN
jgi:hypothetical protein